MGKYLVTGARGRLGSALSVHLAGNGHEVSRFSRNADAIHISLDHLADHASHGADVLMHLAWSGVPSTSELSPGIEWREDLPLLSGILSELLKIMRSGGRPPLFVFFSSCSVYGESHAPEGTFSEADPKVPKGWYARGKAEAENLIEGFQSLGLPVLILRITNPYGFVQRPGVMQGMIPALLHSIKESRVLDVWGDGSAIKDFIHIHDLLHAVDLLVARQATGIFNVASGRPTRIRDLISLVERQWGKTVSLKCRPAGSWDVQNGRYSNARLSNFTGWQPKIGLEQGIQKYAQQYFG